jgi:hypothetical protein
MHRLRFVITAALVLAGWPLSGQVDSSTNARHASTTVVVQLRETPVPGGRVLATLPRASLVDVGDCDPSWCAIRFRGRVGFGPVRSLVFSRPIESAGSAGSAAPTVEPRGRGYVNSRGEWVPSPVRTPDGRAPAGASAHCRDGTYSFSRSRRGTCSHHGGVAEWL